MNLQPKKPLFYISESILFKYSRKRLKVNLESKLKINILESPAVSINFLLMYNILLVNEYLIYYDILSTGSSSNESDMT